MEKAHQCHAENEVLNKPPEKSKIPLEDLSFEYDREPEIPLYPPPPKENICSPSKLADYYERHVDKAFDAQKRLDPIFQYFVQTYPTVAKWIKYAKSYEYLGYPWSARSVLRRAGESYGEQGLPQELLDYMIKFEARQKKFDDIYKAYTVFGKEYGSRGDRSDIEEAVFWKIKFELACRIQCRPAEHHVWLRYIALLKSEDSFSYEDIRGVYRAALEQGPSYLVKRQWVKYVRLWMDYASFEEENDNVGRCREVYAACLDHIPHDRFTFPLLWLLYVKFEIGQRNLNGARCILRNAVEICSKEKINRRGIDRDDQAVEVKSCRELFEIFLDLEPEDDSMWRRYDEWKNTVGSIECDSD